MVAFAGSKVTPIGVNGPRNPVAENAPSSTALVAAAPESPGPEILTAPPPFRCLPPVPDSAVFGWQKEPLCYNTHFTRHYW